MKRIILMLFRNLIHLPWMAIRLFYYGANADKYSDEVLMKIVREFVFRANQGGNVSIATYGRENLPKKDGFMLYPNHQGMYDMLALVDASQRQVSAVAKKEVEKVIGLKQIMQCLRGFYMDREDVRQSMRIINQVTGEVLKGRNYIIFAEGTRSKMGNKLLEFKGGSFKAATKAKCPIVPVALIDSFMPFDSGTTSQVTVQVHFLEPMYYEEYKDMKTTEIAEVVKTRIEARIAEYEHKHN